MHYVYICASPFHVLGTSRFYLHRSFQETASDSGVEVDRDFAHVSECNVTHAAECKAQYSENKDDVATVHKLFE